MSLTLHMWRVVILLYMGSCCLLPNLTNMHWKSSVGISLHVDAVPMAYQRAEPSLLSQLDLLHFTSFMLYFSLGCQYEVSPAILFSCHYSVYAGPNSVCSPSGHPPRLYLLLNLSPFSYP
jgi:hypothetical protein